MNKSKIVGAERTLNFLYYLYNHTGMTKAIQECFADLGENMVNHFLNKLDGMIGDDFVCRPQHILSWFFELSTSYQYQFLEWVNDNYDNRGVTRQHTFDLPDCSWGRTHKYVTEDFHYEIASSKDYSNGRHVIPSEINQSLTSCIKYAQELRDKNDGRDAYWNNQDEIITKVTTTKEVVHIVRSEDKISTKKEEV